MRSKTPQKISHNHIKIKGIKIVGSKTKQKMSRAINFINQFAPGHQSALQTQQSRNYNHTRRITIQ